MANVTYEREITALLVIDPYNDFISEGGKVWDRLKGVAEANKCVPHMRQVLEAARKADIRVFYALHRRYRPGDYETWKYIAPIQKAAQCAPRPRMPRRPRCPLGAGTAGGAAGTGRWHCLPAVMRGERKVGREMEKYAQTTASRLTVMQRVAICFTGGVLGALAVVLFSHVLFGVGISGALGVKGPASLQSPDIYRPLFWGGLWGIPFGLCIKTAWERLYLFGLLYFLVPVLALFVIFLPMSGAGYFGLRHGGPLFTAYLLLVNVPFGITTAVAARAIIGKQP